jgi:hypothetical protein
MAQFDPKLPFVGAIANGRVGWEPECPFSRAVQLERTFAPDFCTD